VRSHVVNKKPKIARRCGAKCISKSKCEKTNSLRRLLEVGSYGPPLWRKAHFQVKMLKNHMVRPLLEVGSKNGTPLWREAHVQLKKFKTLAFWTIFEGSDR